MEVFFITRGKTNEVDEWRKWMSTRHLPLKIKHPSKPEKDETALVECQLRPIQLWGFTFPRENLDIVLNTLKLPSHNPFYKTAPDKPTVKINKKLWVLRKLLGAEKIPEPKTEKGAMFLPYNRIENLNIIGIGLKDDEDIIDTSHERI